MSSIPFVFVSATRLSVSIPTLIFVIPAGAAAVPVVSAASVAPPLSRRRRSAAVAVSDRGVASLAPSGGGEPLAGLAGASLQARGAECVEEEALVGASKRTFQPSSRAHSLSSDSGPVGLLEELFYGAPGWDTRNHPPKNWVM